MTETPRETAAQQIDTQEIDENRKGAKLVSYVPTGTMQGYHWPENHGEQEAVVAALNRLHATVLWYKQTLLAAGPVGAAGIKTDQQRDVLEIVDTEPVNEQRESFVIWPGDFIEVTHVTHAAHNSVRISVWPAGRIEEERWTLK